MNRYFVNCPATVIATDDDNLITGTKGKRWKGSAIEMNGDVTNWLKDQGFIYQDAIVENKTDMALSKIVTIHLPNNLVKDKDNHVQVPLSTLEFSKDVEIIGIMPIGVVADKKNAPVISFLREEMTISCFIVKNALMLDFSYEMKEFFDGRKINLIIYYR